MLISGEVQDSSMHANWEFRESLHTGLSKPANLDIAIRTQFAIQHTRIGSPTHPDVRFPANGDRWREGFAEVQTSIWSIKSHYILLRCMKFGGSH